MSNLDKYLDITNEEKKKRGLDTYIPLYPMFRIQDNKLYIGVMLTDDKDNVWSKDEQIKAEYWVLIDPNTDKILEFNETSKKDFIISDLIPKKSVNKQKEISEYTVKKSLQYKEYLINDIKNSELPLQKKLSSILGSTIEVDNEQVNINDYLLAILENDIKEKIDDLVNVLTESKYVMITFYYGKLFTEIINEYKNSHNIDDKKLNLCIEIMDNYYDGVIGISNFFKD